MQGQEVYEKDIDYVVKQKIHPGDLLSVIVSSLSPQANALFNQGVILPAGSSSMGRASGMGVNPNEQGYLVDEAGFIVFPVLGKVELGGLTKEEAMVKLTIMLEEYLQDPIVNIRYLNYRITVIGEVTKPASYTIPSEKVTVLEALGLAGDMTAFGKRENVMVIREESGKRKISRLNLNSSEVFESPYFYLQQNDVVYVEPVKTKAEQASLRRSNISIVLSAASVLAIIITRLL